jgi:uncharacterized membrane protein YczE
MVTSAVPSKKVLMIRRIVTYVLGLFFIALGVSLSVKSNLGITPVNSVPYIISLLSGLDQGLMTAIAYTFFVLFQIALLRKEFQPRSFLQVLIAILFGYFLSLCNRLLFFPSPEIYPLRLGMMVLSVVVISLGILLYLVPVLIPQPAEGLCLAIEKKSGWKYHNIKIGFDCSMVALAALICFLASGRVYGIREGTLIAMIGVGMVLGVFLKLFKPKLYEFCFGSADSETGPAEPADGDLRTPPE